MLGFYQHHFRWAAWSAIVIVALTLPITSCAFIKKDARKMNTSAQTLQEAEQALGDIPHRESEEEQQRLHQAITEDQTLESQTKKQSKGTG